MFNIFIFAPAILQTEYMDKFESTADNIISSDKFDKKVLKDLNNKEDVIFLDYQTFKNFESAAQAVTFIKENYPYNRIFLISNEAEIKDIFALLKLGVLDFLMPPFSKKRISELIHNTNKVFSYYEHLEINKLICNELGLVGNSISLKNFTNDIQNAHNSDDPIILSGELGSEKFKIAHFFHNHQNPKGDKLIRQNCQNFISGELSLAEVIQALINKPVSGTLLLEEVNLYKERWSDFISEVLKLFNKNNLHERLKLIFTFTIKAGETYHTNQYPEQVKYIHIPELRNIKTDIPALIYNRLQKLSEQYLTPAVEISDAALSHLKDYDFPGNFFELNNLIDSLFIQIMNDSEPKITVNLIPNNLAQSNPLEAHLNIDFSLMSSDLKSARSLFEKQYLVSQIKRFGGNISQTSAFIGMERTALHRKLISLGIDSDFLRKSLK